MIWILVTAVAVCATFAGTYHATGEVWKATNASGVLALLSLIVLVARLTRPPVSPGERKVVIGIFVVMIAGVAAHWFIMWSTTNFQYDSLQAIRREIERGVFYSALEDRSMAAYTAYYRQAGPREKSLGTVFREQNRQMIGEPSLLDTLGEGMCSYVTLLTDSVVVLTGESGFTAGRNPEFRNSDGRTGLVQVRLHLSLEGIDYESEN